MNSNELKEIVKKAVEKDNAAMEQLYKAYYEDVCFVCKKYGLSEEDVRDIAQDTFIQGFEKLNTLNKPETFPSWIQRIAANKCLNLLKHNKVINVDSIYDDNGEIFDLPADGKSTEEIVIDNETSRILSDMMSKLPVEQRVTLFMFYYQNYSIKEIAAMYGCPENTVSSRLNYAKKAMRAEAERLEDKGIKLRVVAVLPFLYFFFKNERSVYACTIPDCAPIISQVMSVAGGAVAAGVSKGLIALITGAVAGVAGIIAAVVIATNDGKKSDSGKATGIVENVTIETTTDDIPETETTEVPTTETPTLEEPTTAEPVEKLELRDIKSIDFVAPSVVKDDPNVADFFWDFTEDDLINWYKDKGYYTLTDNPVITIEESDGPISGRRTYKIHNQEIDGDTWTEVTNCFIEVQTGIYNPDEVHHVKFRYDGELEDGIAKMTEFIELMGLGEYADDLIHAENRVKINTEDNVGEYYADTYYFYDERNKQHDLSFEIYYYQTVFRGSNYPANTKPISEYFDLSEYFTETEFDTTDITAFKNDIYKFIVSEIDPSYVEGINVYEMKYTYNDYPETDSKSKFEFEYNIDMSQEGVTFNNNRFFVNFNGEMVYIKLPVNAPYNHSVIKYEDMTEEDYISTATARQKVLKKLFPSKDFTVDELVKAMKDKIDEHYTYIFFNSGDYKCKLGMEYEYLEIMINIE